MKMGSLRIVLLSSTGLLGGCFDLGDGGAAPGSTGEPDPGPLEECLVETFEPICVEDGLLYCSEDGEIRTRSCVNGGCVYGSDGADCVWPLDEPCDSTYSACVDPGGIRACVDGRWTFEPCAPGGSCIGDTCYGPAAIPCDYDGRRCEGELLFECNSDGIEVEVECPEGSVCRDGDDGPLCAAADAEHCESDVFVPQCSERGELVRCPNGWTTTQTCPEGEACFSGPTDALCNDANATPCDPSTAPPSCNGDLASTCTPYGVLWEFDCGEAEQCAVGSLCLGECFELALCVPEDAPTCEGTGQFCDGEDLAVCFGGYSLVLHEDCACTEGKDGPTCT